MTTSAEYVCNDGHMARTRGCLRRTSTRCEDGRGGRQKKNLAVRGGRAARRTGLPFSRARVLCKTGRHRGPGPWHGQRPEYVFSL